MSRTYTDDQRAQALEMFRIEGPHAVERTLGIPASTIRGWARKAGVETEVVVRSAAGAEANRQRWALRRAEMVAEIGEAAQLALTKAKKALHDGQARPAQSFATTMAILIDKAQL